MSESASSDEAELEAAKALHRRIQRARRNASLTCMLVGLVLGAVLAVFGQGLMSEHLGSRVALLATVVVFFAPLLGALKIAELIADGTVKSNISKWITELAKQYGVAESTLDDHARIAGVERR